MRINTSVITHFVSFYRMLCTDLGDVIGHLLPQPGQESRLQQIPRVPDGADAEDGEVAVLAGRRLLRQGGHEQGKLLSGVIE